MKHGTFLHQSVANLAWCIGSHPLMLSHPKASFKTLDEAWFNKEYERHVDWLWQLDQNPKPLENHLSSEHRLPLGKQFERYISFWLKESPFFDLLAENVQLKGNSNTVGELDFLFRASESHINYHMEVACKFYLSARNTPNWEYWIGSNANDRLKDKMDKLEKQLRATELPEGIDFLQSNRISTPEKVLLMKGMFFHHFKDLRTAKAPKYASPGYQPGWWLHQSEMKGFFSSRGSWIILPKDRWLTNYHVSLNEEMVMSGYQIIDAVEQLMKKHRRSVMVAQLFPGGEGWEEGSRGFVVPDHWPNRH